jgi:hypothetical protein
MLLTPAKKMTVHDILESCGGQAAVAYKLGGLHTHTVERWKRNGIPSKYWALLVKLARKASVELTSDDILQANQKAKAKAATR